jgi:hypothetical protein
LSASTAKQARIDYYRNSRWGKVVAEVNAVNFYFPVEAQTNDGTIVFLIEYPKNFTKYATCICAYCNSDENIVMYSCVVTDLETDKVVEQNIFDFDEYNTDFAMMMCLRIGTKYNSVFYRVRTIRPLALCEDCGAPELTAIFRKTASEEHLLRTGIIRASETKNVIH